MNAHRVATKQPARPELPAQAALVDSLKDAAWLVDAASLTVSHANAAAGGWLGATPASLVGRPADTLLPMLEDMAFWAEVRSGLSSALASETELPLPDGRVAHVMRRVVPVQPMVDGEPLHAYLVTLHNLSREREAEREREVLLAELRATLESTADGILVTDLSGRIQAFNRRFAALWSLPETALTERDDQRVHDWMRLNVSQPLIYQQRLEAIQQHMLLDSIDTIPLVDGTKLERHSQPQWSHGRPIGRVYSFRELNRRRPGAPRRDRSDPVDDWTQLPLRSGFVARLDAAVSAARNGGPVFSVLCIEYDREALFGAGLDDASHARTMADLTEGLRAGLRTPHLVARLGGARFGVLLDGAGDPAAEAMARRLLEQSRMVTPGALATDGLAAVVGLASYPQAGLCADDLINHAEQALAQARRDGSGYRAHRFTAPLDTHRQQRLEQALRGGMGDASFRIRYLPRASARSGQIQAVEALVRWHDGQSELLPAQFVPLAEKAGLAGTLDDWVMEQAVRQAASWRACGLNLRLTLNVSGWQLSQPNFVRRLDAVLQHAGLPAERLELDVTEMALTTDAEAALPAIKALRRLGVGVVLDDFGSGLASLALLRRFPFTAVKIDRSLIASLSRSKADEALVGGLIQMLKAMSLEVLAEGVETEGQRRFVVEQGCTGWQGLYCAAAMEPRQVMPWVRETLSVNVPRRRVASRH